MGTRELSRRLRAAEDIRVGDHVAVLRTVYELVPWLIEPSVCANEIEPVRVRAIPDDAGRPMRVVGVCLPFVMVEDVNGQRYPLDTRRQVLARVSTRFAKSAKRPDRKRKKGRGKKKRCKACEAR